MGARPLTYAGSGVDYDSLDPFKRKAQAAAAGTEFRVMRLGFRAGETGRGESAYLLEGEDCYLAQVEEGLGTKNLVGDAMYALTGQSYYDHLAQDTVAMIVNDMITCGALPLSVAMHLAVGSSDWFNNEQRANDLVAGWKEACIRAGCAWGGGETPTLQGIVNKGTVVLSGSAIGIVRPKGNLITPKIQHGDRIVILTSSGIHANGLTLARQIARQTDYLALLSDGRTYGEALLDPTHLYVDAMEAFFAARIPIHYAVNITGHGWRKLMRAPEPFLYVVEELPPVQPVFSFMQEHGPVTDEEAYGNLNMGAGFAIFVPLSAVKRVMAAMDTLLHSDFQAIEVGHVETSSEKKVVIKPKGLEYAASTLGVR